MSELFLESSYKERVSVFEKIKKDTELILNNPLFTQVLPYEFDGIRSAHENSFLPNIRNGQIEIPRHYRDTDSIALVPLILSDKSIDTFPIISRQAHYPAHSRLMKIKNALATTDQLNDLEVDRRIDKIVSEAASGNDFDAMRIHRILFGSSEDNGSHGVSQTTVGYPPDAAGEYFTSRPIVFLNPEVRLMSSPALASISLHEYWHSLRTFEREGEISQADEMTEELEAYHISRLCLYALGQQIKPNERDDFYFVELIDELRLEHADKDAPFAMNDTLSEALEAEDLLDAFH